MRKPTTNFFDATRTGVGSCIVDPVRRDLSVAASLAEAEDLRAKRVGAVGVESDSVVDLDVDGCLDSGCTLPLPKHDGDGVDGDWPRDVEDTHRRFALAEARNNRDGERSRRDRRVRVILEQGAARSAALRRCGVCEKEPRNEGGPEDAGEAEHDGWG